MCFRLTLHDFTSQCDPEEGIVGSSKTQSNPLDHGAIPANISLNPFPMNKKMKQILLVSETTPLISQSHLLHKFEFQAICKAFHLFADATHVVHIQTSHLSIPQTADFSLHFLTMR
jgi:hypothetical protein